MVGKECCIGKPYAVPLHYVQVKNFALTARHEATNQTETAKTGKELDIRRKSPYAGLTMGEKG